MEGWKRLTRRERERRQYNCLFSTSVLLEGIVPVGKHSYIIKEPTDTLQLPLCPHHVLQLAVQLLIWSNSVTDLLHVLVWYCLYNHCSVHPSFMFGIPQITHAQAHTHAPSLSSLLVLTPTQSGWLDLPSPLQISWFYYHTPLNFHERLSWSRSQGPSCLSFSLICRFLSC